MRQEFVQLSDIRLSVRVDGEPGLPAVVLLHGGGLMGTNWTPVVRRLSERYLCIAPDMRGHGDSDWDGERRYDLSDYDDDLTRLVRHYGLTRPRLVGMSLGGQVALHAVCHGLDVESLTLVDVGPKIVPNQNIRDFLGIQSYPSFDAALERAAQYNSQRSRESLATSLRRSMRQRPDGSWIWKWDPSRLTSRDNRHAEAENLWPLLSSIRVPVLLVRGDNSPVLPAPLAEEFFAELRRVGVDAEFATVPGAGHNVQTEQADQLTALLDAFFARTAADHRTANGGNRHGFTD